MNNFISSFSLYEFLRILMPGAYLTLNVSQFVKYTFPDYDAISRGTQFNQVEATIIFAIVAVVLGVFVYSMDNPRLLSYLFKNLPSNLIKDRHRNAGNILVLNSYFAFYDSLPDAVKMKTEKQSGFMHLSLDMVFVNIISLVLLLISELSGSIGESLRLSFQAHLIMVVFLLLICCISAALIYSKRLKFTYIRTIDLYYDSEEYKRLLEKIDK